MLFEIVHVTDYRYSHPAREAYIEARLSPPSRPGQEVVSHELSVQPSLPVSTYVDYFGNTVSVGSYTLRHERLVLTNRLTIRTSEIPLPAEPLEVSVAEARQLTASKLTDIFDYLQPTAAVPTGGMAMEWARRFFPGHAPLGSALAALNETIYTKFRYQPGTTTISTPLDRVWKRRMGVCQDFAHIMLSILRTAGIPARYVCGYIESDPPSPKTGASALVGALATHAWVEALVPGNQWVALDPTNNQWCGPRHVAVSFGRDYADAAPVRGTFKGSGPQNMKVKVTMKRLGDKA